MLNADRHRKPTTVIKPDARTAGFTGWLCLLAACALLSACGEEAATSSTSEDYEKALFMAYATTKSSEYMHAITTADMIDLIDELELIVADAYLANDNDMPSRIDLSSPPSGVIVPDGMTGTITQSSSLGIEVDISLDDCVLDSDTNRAYTGTFSGSGICGISSYTHTIAYMTFNSSSLRIVYTDRAYEKAVFSDFYLGVDNTDTYPAYTLNGTVTIDGTAYYYDNFFYQKTGSTSLSVSGVVSFDGAYVGVDGDDIEVNASSGLWTEGDLTLTSQDSDGTVDETVTVTISGTTASFEVQSDSSSTESDDSWDWDYWYSDRLVP